MTYDTGRAVGGLPQASEQRGHQLYGKWLHKLYWDKSTPSERQRDDVAGVFKVQQANLDRAYLSDWAAELGVEASLQLLFNGKLKPKST
jgi:hypothetical protein